LAGSGRCRRVAGAIDEVAGALSLTTRNAD
jgi:hypothetical protein